MGMILHCVFYHFRQEAAPQQRQEIVQELARFSQSLDGVLGFEHGPNRDFEKKSQGYDSGFVIRFTSQEALATYAITRHIKPSASACAILCKAVPTALLFSIWKQTASRQAT